MRAAAEQVAQTFDGHSSGTVNLYDRQILKRINRLIDDALRDPTQGIGKPEPLKHVLTGAWSRRITEEHRLVYLVDGDDVVIMQARFRYK